MHAGAVNNARNKDNARRYICPIINLTKNKPRRCKVVWTEPLSVEPYKKSHNSSLPHAGGVISLFVQIYVLLSVSKGMATHHAAMTASYYNQRFLITFRAFT